MPEFPVFSRLCGLCPHPASGIRWKGKDTKLNTLPVEQDNVIPSAIPTTEPESIVLEDSPTPNVNFKAEEEPTADILSNSPTPIIEEIILEDNILGEASNQSIIDGAEVISSELLTESNLIANGYLKKFNTYYKTTSSGTYIVITSGGVLASRYANESDFGGNVISITLAADVDTVGPTAIANYCKKYIVASDNTSFKVTNGALTSYDGKILYAYPCKAETKDYFIPSGVETIYTGAFAYNKNIENLFITDGVKNIGGSFADYSKIKSVYMSDSVLNLGSQAFYGCKNLLKIKLSSKLEKLEGMTFGHCDSLEEILIPDSVKSLSFNEFYGAINLKHVYIGAGVENNIKEAGLFVGCYNMEEVEISLNNLYFCSKDGVIFDKQMKCLIYYPPAKQDTSYIIPNSVEEIVDGAMYYASNLKKIILSKNFSKFTEPYDSKAGSSAGTFSGLASLTDIEVPIDNIYFSSVDGVLFNKDMTKLLYYPVGKLNISYEIPEKVKELGYCCFRDNPYLRNIIIKKNVSKKITALYYSDAGFSYSDYSPDNVCIYCENGSKAEEFAKSKNFNYQYIVPLMSISLEPTICSMCIGETKQLEVSYLPTDTTESIDVVWESSDSSIVAVNNGILAAKATGTAVIVARVAEKSATCTVTVTENSSGPSTKPSWVFVDVSVIPDNWKYENIKYVYENNIMTGVKENEFQPDVSLTRAMFASVIYRMAGSPKVTYKNIFSDVPSGKWYSSAIIWAYEKRIVAGLGNGRYGINDNITREQMARMLMEFAKVQGYDTGERADFGKFADASQVSRWATDNMRWAVGSGIISGSMNDGKYYMNPKGQATRAECAVMLTKFLQKY